MSSVELKAQKREVFGKHVNQIREKGLIPAELYGREVENFHLSVDAKEFKKVLEEAGESTVLSLVIASPDSIADEAISRDEKIAASSAAKAGTPRNDDDIRSVLIYNVHRHSVTDEVLSVDFYQVRMDETVETEVQLEFMGESLAVKDKNGVLVKVMQEVTIEALPADIPREIMVDISKLVELDQSLCVGDLVLPKNVKLITEPESVVVSVKPQMTEEEAKALEAEGAEMKEAEVEGEEITGHPEASAEGSSEDSSQAQNDKEKKE